MATYYISACHDCKEKVMWLKCPIETAERWHKEFHKGHETEMSNDYDDEFMFETTRGYKSLGIIEGE